MLITGESGTGKELVAAAIHAASRRAGRAVRDGQLRRYSRATWSNPRCSGTSGASFTGATERRLGRFELAHGGSLFLDEIGDLSARGAGQAPAHARDRRASAHRRGDHDADRRQGHRGHQQAARGGGERRRFSAKTSSSGSTSSRSSSRRCGSGWRTCPRWWPTWPSGSGPATRRPSPPPRSRPSPRTPGPGNVRELANLVERLSILSGPRVDAGAVRQVLRGRRAPAARGPDGAARSAAERGPGRLRAGLIMAALTQAQRQHGRGGPNPADRSRQPLPPDAAVGPRQRGVVEPSTISHREPACACSSPACMLLLACPVLRAQDSVIVIDPDAPPGRLASCAAARLPTWWLSSSRFYNDSATTRMQGDVTLPPAAAFEGRLALFRGSLRIAGRVRGRHRGNGDPVPAAGRGRRGRDPGRGRPADPSPSRSSISGASGCSGMRRR